ncbi:MAG: DUF5522 domain-containing protein [Ferruginibacter sp.]
MKQIIDDDEKYDAGSFEPLSAEYLLDRGYCCGNGCKNCPFNYKMVPQPLRERLLKNRELNNEREKNK